MYQIITDGSWDMGPECEAAYGVKVIPYMITTDGEHYQKEIEELGIEELYQKMVEDPKLFPKTSLPSMRDYIEVFEMYAAQGIDIICFTLSAKFSGSYNAAVNSKEEVLERYPNVRITVVDSEMATLMQGLMIKEIVSYQKTGASYDDVLQRFAQIKDSANIFFTVENMNYLIHGGRIGKLAGTSANLLNLRPMIQMKQGELFSAGLARGRRQSREKAIQLCFEYVEKHGNDPSDFAWMTGYGYDQKEGIEFHDHVAAKIKERWPGFEQEVEIGHIGATIGVHTGPHPLGLGIIEKAIPRV